MSWDSVLEWSAGGDHTNGGKKKYIYKNIYIITDKLFCIFRNTLYMCTFLLLVIQLVSTTVLHDGTHVALRLHFDYFYDWFMFSQFSFKA